MSHCELYVIDIRLKEPSKQTNKNKSKNEKIKKMKKNEKKQTTRIIIIT